MKDCLQIINLKVNDYAHSLIERLNQRFHDLQTDDFFTEIKLLETCLWPKDMDALIVLWKEQLSSMGKKGYDQW